MKKNITFDLNKMFILIMINWLLVFVNEFLLFFYQAFSLKANIFYVIISFSLQIAIVFMCFILYKKAELRKSNTIIPIMAIALSVYYTFFREYNLVSLVDSDLNSFEELIDSTEVTISFYSERIILILIYIFLLIQGIYTTRYRSSS